MIDLDEVSQRIRTAYSKIYSIPGIDSKTVAALTIELAKAIIREAELRSMADLHPAVKEAMEQLEMIVALTKKEK